MEASKLEVTFAMQRPNRIINNTTRKRKIYTHTCDLCNKQYKSKDSLDFHCLSHTGEKPVKCRLCLSRFKTKKCLQKHYNRIHTENFLKERQPTTCNICGLKAINMKRHLTTHTGEKRFKCAICNKQYREKNSLEFHVKSHTGERPYKCPECSFSFKTKKCVRLHYMRIHSPKPQNIKRTVVECQICNRQLSSSTNLKRHLITHTGEKPFRCKLCSNRYTVKNSLAYHMLSHTGSKPFECSVCGISFKLKELLKRHSLRHKSKHSGTKYKTEENHLNSPELKSTQSVKSHIKVENLNETELIPTIPRNAGDQETSTNEFSLKLIKIEQHSIEISGEKPFPLFGINDYEEILKCETFEDKPNINQNIRNEECIGLAKNVHIFLQHSERPFQCIKCSSCFETEESVRSHYTKIHSSQLPKIKQDANTRCNICLRQLSSIWSLNRHMVIHTGEKKFSCSICTNRYTAKESLNYHMISHTGIKPFKCLDCASCFKSKSMLIRHTKNHIANSISKVQ